ncbi:MAG TPA: HIT family protein [Candidatus Saccharimonadales bacterium]|nr:HIT family protein [Candidatus Saccharimonadales bacterium]
MQTSIFTKIIHGELPSHKVFEDDKTFAFLDIHPIQPGQTLVVPKMQVDRIEDLSEEDYHALMSSVKKVMKRIVEVFGKEYRACVRVEGFIVPHVHVVIIPCRVAEDFMKPPSNDEPDHEALAEMAKKLAF